MTNRRQALTAASLVAVLTLGGCTGSEPDYEDVDAPVPPGAVPAAPDVRPGTESAPGGAMPSGATPAAGDQAVPTDTAGMMGTGDTSHVGH